jgi:hypothetical protein
VVRSGLAVLAIALSFPVSTRAQATREESAEWNIPGWAAPTVHAYLRQHGLRLFLGVNPFYLQGDFHGDGRLDLAVQVQDSSSNKRGILIIHRKDLAPHLLGAGVTLGTGGDDFSWQSQWSVDDASVLKDTHAVGHQLLYVGKGDSAGGLVWWNGRRYVWTQWGD